jgi:hypothetical protein
MASNYGKKLATTAVGQHDQYHYFSENDEPLTSQIERYWTELGFNFPGVGEAWSAVFISWCVQSAGATASEFLFNPQHSQYVNKAIDNAAKNLGVFRASRIADYAPTVGDIIHMNRGGTSFDYDYARTHKSYASHCAIVVESGHDENGPYALTIGGNETDSVGQKIVRVDANGLVVQRPTNPYICVIQDLK